jgi:hypothetical protein
VFVETQIFCSVGNQSENATRTGRNDILDPEHEKNFFIIVRGVVNDRDFITFSYLTG